jgi:hypothetical protein
MSKRPALVIKHSKCLTFNNFNAQTKYSTSLQTSSSLMIVTRSYFWMSYLPLCSCEKPVWKYKAFKWRGGKKIPSGSAMPNKQYFKGGLTKFYFHQKTFSVCLTDSWILKSEPYLLNLAIWHWMKSKDDWYCVFPLPFSLTLFSFQQTFFILCRLTFALNSVHQALLRSRFEINKAQNKLSGHNRNSGVIPGQYV